MPDALLDVVDGILLTGARANVHPTRYCLQNNPRPTIAIALALVSQRHAARYGFERIGFVNSRVKAAKITAINLLALINVRGQQEVILRLAACTRAHHSSE